MPDKQTVKIFIASSNELTAERELSILLINQLNKSHKHLHLEPVEWEYDVVKGNLQEGYQYIQQIINPKLLECNIIVFLFYSRLGQYTKEEFELATKEKKKLFNYFKKGFSPKKETYAAYGELLDFKESLNTTVLYEEYETLTEFEKFLFPALNLYLIETYPVAAINAPDANLSQSVLSLVQQLAAKDEEIKQLREANRALPPFENEEQLNQLIKDKEALQQQLLQSKEIQEQQAKDKVALEQQLSLQIEHDELKKKALNEVEKGNYAEAEEYLKESAKTSIEETAATFYELAKIKQLQLQYKEAFDYYALAVKIAPKNSVYLNDAGVMANNLGLYDKAIEYYEKALILDRKNYEEKHPDVATRYNNLGEAYRNKGEFEKAIDYFNKALVIYMKYFGKEHPYIAICYNNLGTAYDSKGEFDKAIEYYNNALSINRKNYGEEHPNIAIRYNNLGLAYDNKGEYDKAIEYYNKALVILKKYYAEEHPYIASTYNNFGLAYDNKGEYNKAIEYYNIALIMYQKFLPPNHPSIQITQQNLQYAQQAKTNQ